MNPEHRMNQISNANHTHGRMGVGGVRGGGGLWDSDSVYKVH